jgi:hypothetical protein
MANADTFLGLTKKGAQDRAEALNLVFRLISIDGESYFSYPEDQRQDRICVEITGGKVTKAVLQ